MDANLDFVPTKSSMWKHKAKSTFQAVVYESYKVKPKINNYVVEELQVEKNESQKEIDMKRARHEVIKFGMSGLDRNKKGEAKIQLAIKLGAKPPKNKNRNYKEILLEKKKEKELLKKETHLQNIGKDSTGKSSVKVKKFYKKRKKDQVEILNEYGKPTLKNNLKRR